MTVTDLDAFDSDAGSCEFWHPSEDGPIDPRYLDAGPVAPGSSGDVRLRVYNSADGYTAAAVVVAVESPTAPATSVDTHAHHLLSVDGRTFGPAIVIGDLAPQQVSAAFWLRRITPPGTPAGGGGYALSAAPTAWIAAAAAADPLTGAGGAGTGYDPAAANPSPEQGENLP